MRQKFVRFKKKHYLCSANFFHVDLLEHHLNKNKMKRVFFLLVAIMSMLAAQAQTQQSCVIRSGNTYIVDGQAMNKKAFDGFLKNTNATAYNKFNNGYKLSKAGWGLFGGGLGLETVAFIMAAATPAVAMKTADNASDEAVVKTSVGYTTGMVLAYVVGAAATTAGIVCLGVGYGRMHNAADVYNVDCQKKPVAELQLTAGRGTIGLACKF